VVLDGPEPFSVLTTRGLATVLETSPLHSSRLSTTPSLFGTFLAQTTPTGTRRPFPMIPSTPFDYTVRSSTAWRTHTIPHTHLTTVPDLTVILRCGCPGCGCEAHPPSLMIIPALSSRNFSPSALLAYLRSSTSRGSDCRH
jgi:hypothetical protein